MSLESIKRAYEQVELAEKHYHQEIADAVRVGSAVSWERQGFTCYGTVEMVSGDRIKVRNVYTDRTYWIRPHCLLDI